MSRAVPALTGAIAFAFMAWLYVQGDLLLYRGLVRAWGVKVWAFPFLDTDTVLSAVRCLNRGVDAYVTNPCDVLGRQYDYSPMWMVLRVFPMTRAWLSPIGLLVDGVFLLSLLLLPPGRDARATALIVLGVFSSATVFALERGNNDLLLFALAAGGAALALRGPTLRLVGYALILLAGLLKYYPLAAMLSVCRERLPRFVAVALASIAITAAFVAITWHDLVRALAIIPIGSFSEDMFGSVIVAGRIADQAIHSSALKTVIRLSMTLGSFAAALFLSRRSALAVALDRLTPRERSFLMVGALMVAGCFFTAQNIGYRAVHLLLVLPSLLALARHPGHRLFQAAALSCLALLWSIWWRAIMPVPPISYLTWTLRETMWWFLVTVLDGCLLVMVWQSPTMGGLMEAGLLGAGRRPGRSHGVPLTLNPMCWLPSGRRTSLPDPCG